MSEAEISPLELDRPMFAEAERRLALKKSEVFFFVDRRSGDILRGSVREPGLEPSCDLPQGKGFSSTYVGCLKPDMVWGRTEAEVREKLAKPPAPASAETGVLVVSSQEVGVVVLEERLELERAAGNVTILNDKGGIDLKNVQATAMDLTVRIAHPMSVFGAESMEEIVAEGFINPILYRVLKKEFDELFAKIRSLFAASSSLESLPESVRSTMKRALYASAQALTLQFLQTNGELIQFTQLAAVTKGDFAARALMAIVSDGSKKLRDLPEAARDLVDQFRPR